MRAGSAKRRPSNSLRTRKSRYSVNPAMSRASVRTAKRRVRQNFARSNIRRILLCYGALAGYRDGVKQGKRRPRCSSVALRRHRRCRSDERLQQARGHAGRLLWNRIVFYSTKGLGVSPGGRRLGSRRRRPANLFESGESSQPDYDWSVLFNRQLDPATAIWSRGFRRVLFDQPGLWLPIFLSASAALTIGMPW